MTPATRRWLVAAGLLGFGQQLFVVLRNPYVLAAGYSDVLVARVQGAGGAAGVLAGLLGLFALRRMRDATVLTIAVAANAGGFALQLATPQPVVLFAGAALAGLGIQGITMATAPFLTRQSTPNDRVAVFAAHALALQAIPGALGALTAGYAERAAQDATGSVVDAHRLALALGVLAVGTALVPLALARSAAAPEPLAPRRHRLRDPRGVARLLAPDLLVFAANGVSVPFLQIYFERRFALSPASVGAIYATAMVAAIAPHFISPRIAKRFGSESTTMFAHGVATTGLAALALATTPAVAVTAFVVRQIAASAAAPLYTSVLHTRVHADDSAPAASYRMIAQSVAWAAANFAAGPIVAQFGFGALLACAAATHAAAVALERVAFASVAPPAA